MNWRLVDKDPPNDKDFEVICPDGSINDCHQIKVLMAIGSGHVTYGKATRLFGDTVIWTEEIYDQYIKDYILIRNDYIPYAWCKVENPPRNESVRKLILQKTPGEEEERIRQKTFDEEEEKS